MTRLVVRGVLRRLVVVPDATVRPFTSCDVPQRIFSRARTTIQPLQRNNAVPAFVFCCCAAVDRLPRGRGRPRGKRRASPGVGGAKRPCTPSTASRAPLPAKNRAAAKFLHIAWWNHGKNRVLPVAVAWKVVLRNRAATRKRLHMVWRRKESGMMALFAPMAR